MLFRSVGAFAVDLVLEERTPSRRSASLAPRSPIEIAPAIWCGVATLCVAMVVPFVADALQRAAAIVVGLCALVMAGIAWRIATAPAHLTGGDPQVERVRERSGRALRSGVAAALSVAIVFVFASFAAGTGPLLTPSQRFVEEISFWIFLVLWLGSMLYAWLVCRTASAA